MSPAVTSKLPWEAPAPLQASCYQHNPGVLNARPASCPLGAGGPPPSAASRLSFLSRWHAVRRLAPFRPNRSGRTRCSAEGGTDGADPASKASLEALDRQLDFLSQKSGRTTPSKLPSPSWPSDGEPPPAGLPAGRGRPRVSEIGPSDWPEFDEGFVAFAGISLILLTICTNLLFRATVGGPASERGGQQETAARAAGQGQSRPGGFFSDFGKVYRPIAAPREGAPQ